EVLRQFLRRAPGKRTLVGAVNDVCALAALRAFDEIGGRHLSTNMSQNAIPDARAELRRPGTGLVGRVAYFPERYGDELMALALKILQKKSPPSTAFVKHQLITARNVDLLYPLDNRDIKIGFPAPRTRTATLTN